MIELGITKYEIDESLIGTIYQRLLPHKKIDKEYKLGMLLDYSFVDGSKSDWENNLRKAWAYGFIEKNVYEEETS